MDRSSLRIPKLRIRVPGSTSNLGSGFDTVSAALSLYLKLEVEITDATGIEWPAGWSLPEEENMIWQALKNTCKRINFPLPGMKIEVENEIPLKRGLGSSAAAIISGIKLAEALSGKRLSSEEIFEIAFPLEKHPDNLSASALGGWAISRVENGKMKAERLTSRLTPTFVVAIPETSVSTAEARAILPDSFSLADAVFNLQRVALLIHALAEGRDELLEEACQDVLHQAYRAQLVPGLESILQKRELGKDLDEAVMAITVSGSGSTILALVRDQAASVGRWMVSQLEEAGTPALFQVLTLDQNGPVVVQ